MVPEGFKHNQETIERMRESKRGANNPNFGRRPSLEIITKGVESRKRNTEERGFYHSSETIEKIRQANLGQKRSEQTRKRMSDARKGKYPWNKGVLCSEDTKSKISGANKGREPWNKNRSWDEDVKRKIGEANSQKVWTEEERRRLSVAMKGVLAGEKNPAWKGGISFGSYGADFTVELKEQVRQFDSYSCQGPDCSVTQEEHLVKYGCQLIVHHIDYDKKNNVLDNLVALCLSCHAKTNWNREWWSEYYCKRKEQGLGVGKDFSEVLKRESE